MILDFPYDDKAYGCIAWGKVTGGRYAKTMNPVEVETMKDGCDKYTFRMTVNNTKVGTKWESEFASVSAYDRDQKKYTQKMTDVIKLFRSGDMVMVFGKDRPQTWTDAEGGDHLTHYITADVILPVEWLYDFSLALFAEIIAKAEQPRRREVKGQDAPRQKGRKPQITHPTVLDEKEAEEWFE